MSSKEQVYTKLLKNFIVNYDDLKAITIINERGDIIAGTTTGDGKTDNLSILSKIINPVLEKVRKEFTFKTFGMASFDIDEYRLLFISINENTVLSIILDNVASIDKISPYALFLAEKVAQILTTEDYEAIQLTIPSFQCESETTERLKHQIYKDNIDIGRKYHFKFIVIGDSAVGKTSLVRRFVENTFSLNFRATLGLNVLSYEFELLGNEINLLLWDIGGQEFFKRYRRMYYEGAQAALIIFDITNYKSFEHLKDWYDELQNYMNGAEEFPIIIIGNKMDLKEERVIHYKDIWKIGEVLNLDDLSKVTYIETSALNGNNVKGAFYLLIYQYLQKKFKFKKNELRNNLCLNISNILKKKSRLTLAFYTENPYWSPPLQILTQIRILGEFKIITDDINEKIIECSNGLILKNYTGMVGDLNNVDGIYCIFDAKDKENIEARWKELIVKIIEEIKENKIVLIGILVTKDVNWSNIIKDLVVPDHLKKKKINYMIFKIDSGKQLDFYDQLNILLESIEYSI